MASCQTWASSSHIRHPWFDAPVTKRKHRDTLDPDPASDLAAETNISSAYGAYGRDSSLSPPTFAAPSPVPFGLRGIGASAGGSARPPPAKRRRCSPIESGFAQLSLEGAGDAYPRVQELHLPAQARVQTEGGSATMDLDMDADDARPGPAPVPGTATAAETGYIVEEPPSPSSFPEAAMPEVTMPSPAEGSMPEITMRPPPAWYEAAPDRASFPYSLTAPRGARTEIPELTAFYPPGVPAGIVITDLDAFTREEEDAEEKEKEKEKEEEERRRRGSLESSSQGSVEDEDEGEGGRGGGREKGGGVFVNEALLARIRSGAGRVTPSKPEGGASQALVLFRPLPLATFEREQAEGGQQQQQQQQEQQQKPQQEQEAIDVEIASVDDDAMDVEP